MSKAAIFKQDVDICDNLFVTGNITAQDVDICNNLFVTGNITAPGGFNGIASSAIKLETSRTIAGQTFDGQQNVSIASTDLTDTSILVRNNADQTISGVLTANSFVGSGATLTNIPNGALVNSSISINNNTISLGANLNLTESQWTTYTNDIYYESGNVAIGSQTSNSTIYSKLFVDGIIRMSGKDFVIWNESLGGTFDNSNTKGRALVHNNQSVNANKTHSFLIINFDDDFQYGTQIGGQNSHVSINGIPEQYYALYIHNTAADGNSNADVRIEGSLTVDGTILDSSGNSILDSVSLDYIFNDTTEFTLPIYIPGQEPITLESGSVWTLNANGNDIYFNSGKIGIGTNAPSETLHVKDGNIYVEGGDFYAGDPIATMTNGVLGQRLILDKGMGYGGPNKIMLFGSDEGIGIGYDNEIMKYLVSGAKSHRFFYNAGVGNNGTVGMDLTESDLSVNGNISISDTGIIPTLMSSSITISDPSGSFIETEEYAHPFKIKSGINNQTLWMGYDSSENVAYIATTENGVSRPLYLQQKGGGVYIGSSYGSSNLTVTGTTYSNIFQVTSDMTLKENIVELENPLQKILNIQGKNYTWKKDASNILQSGLIAQQVEEYIPELIQENNGIKTVNYNGIIPYLVESVKIQQNEINIQQNEIERLKEENALLKSSLASLLARVESLEKT